MFEFLQSLGQNIVNGFNYIVQWVGSIFISIFNALKEFIATIFRPLILFFNSLWYLLEKCFDIIVIAIQVIFGLFKVMGAVIYGAINTFSQLIGFSGSTDYYYIPEAYKNGFDSVTSFLGQTGLNTIAIIMTVFIWMLTAYAVIRIAGGER